MDMQENSDSHPNALPMSENEKDGLSELQNDTAGHKVDGNSPDNARETLFMIAITLTQLVQMIPLGAGIDSGLSIGESLGATNVQSAWIVASYPLTQGAFVLIGGRLGAVYGHKNIFSIGCIWWVVWALCGGFANNLVSMCFMRGLCEIGGSLMIPNIVALLGITFPPVRTRSSGMEVLSADILASSGLLGLVVYGTAIISVPPDEPVDPNGSVDWVGAYLGVGGLILFNFVWNQAPLVGWTSPYEITLLVLSIIHFGAFSYWKMKMAKEPILPLNIWKAPSFGFLMLTIFFSFMSLGIYFWYMNVYMITIRGDSLIRVGVQYLPLTIVGCANAFFAAWLVPRVPAQVIISMGCLAMTAINILLATIPEHLT